MEAELMTDPSILIRAAETADIPAMVALLKELFTIEADFQFDPEHHQRGLTLMVADCRKHRCVMAAENRGEIVGMASAQTLMSTAEGGIVALVEDVVVKLGWRCRGIGARLLTEIEAWAARRGARRLQLLADQENAAALQFYCREGWQRTRLICLRKSGPFMETPNR
jgi:ribosomal protein S18 acetylase RimI-like enzyme